MVGGRLAVERHNAADPISILGVLCRPEGHVSVDGSSMLMSSPGDHGTVTTSCCDRPSKSRSWKGAGILPVASDEALRGMLGIFPRTVALLGLPAD